MDKKIDNYVSNLQILYEAYKNKEIEKELEYFDYVFKYLIKNNREKDAFYLLFLHGYSFGIPSKYINYYRNMYNAITTDYETVCNGVRDDIYHVCFSDARKILKKNTFTFEEENEILVERFLIEKGINRYYRVENKVNQKAIASEYSSILSYLSRLDLFGQLSLEQKNLLQLVRIYTEAKKTGNVPSPTSNDVLMIFPLLIQTNNFVLAKKMLDDYYDKNPNKDRNSNATYCVLNNIVSLIPVVEEKIEDTKEDIVIEEVHEEKKNLIDDLIALVREGEVSFDEALKRLPLSDDEKNYAMLLMAKDCYYNGNISDGDRYLNIVEKSSHKGSEMKKQVNLLRSRKKFLQFDENKKLVFTK